MDAMIPLYLPFPPSDQLLVPGALGPTPPLDEVLHDLKAFLKSILDRDRWYQAFPLQARHHMAWAASMAATYLQQLVHMKVHQRSLRPQGV